MSIITVTIDTVTNQVSTSIVNNDVYALPIFSTGAKVITVGDSITQYSNFATSTKVSNQGDSIIHWAIRDIPAFQHKQWYDAGATAYTGNGDNPLFRGANFGQSGDTADGLSNRLTPIENISADIAVLLIATNTGDALQTPVAATTTAIQTTLDTLIASGKHVVLGTILPRHVDGTGASIMITPALMQRVIDINAWIRSKASANITIWDAWDDMIDPQYEQGVDDEYGTPLSTMTRDGVHLTPIGAYTAAISLRSLLAQMTGTDMYDDTWFNSDPSDAGNILTYGALSGTGGATANGMTGTLPDNWAGGCASGNISCVASVSSNTDTGGGTARFTYTSDGLGANYEQCYFSPYGFAVDEAQITDGAWVQLMFKVRVVSNDDNLLGAFRCMLRNSTTGKYGHGMEHVSSTRIDQRFTDDTYDAWIISEAIQYNDGDTLLPYLYTDVIDNASGTLITEVDAALLLEVEDPETTFPYDNT